MHRHHAPRPGRASHALRHHQMQHMHKNQLSVPPFEGMDRYATVPVYEKYRARLRDGAYLNATEIDFGPGYTAYIATQAPFPGTVPTLLRLALERRARAIVALEGGVPYWDLEGNESATATYELRDGLYASFVQGPRYGHKKVIYQRGDGTAVFSTDMLFTKTWPDGTVPEPDEIPRLAYILNAMGYAPSTPTSGPVIVMCKAGVARTATLIASHNVVSRVLAGASPFDLRRLAGDAIERFEERRVMNATPAQIGTIPDIVRAALPGARAAVSDARRAARGPAPPGGGGNPYEPLSDYMEE